MMMNNFNKILSTGLNTINRYPIILLSAFVSAISFILFLENEANDVFPKISLTTCLGISLFFALQMRSESQESPKKQIHYIIGSILLILFYIILPEKLKYSDLREGIIIFISFFCSHLLVSFLPFIFTKKQENSFWEYNKNLFINLCFSWIFIGVFIVGINLALLAISNLFNIDLSEKTHIYFSFSSLIFGSCFIFLSFAPKGLTSLEEKTSEYPVVLKFFTQFILIPLLIIYGGILYLYSAKILLTWELPKGWISFMIMAYCSVGIFAFLLVYPLGKSNAKSWVKLFFKIFHYSILPVLVLLFVAIFTRVLEYGFTENRYFVLCYAIWLSVIALYFVFYKNPKIKFIPISLFAFAVFSISMPFLNVFEVSKTSQKKHLEKLLNEYKLLKDGKIDFSKSISHTQANIIVDNILFLSERNEKDFVLQFIAKDKQKDFSKVLNKGSYSADIIKYFNISKESNEEHFYNNYFSIKTPKITPLSDKYDYLISYHQENDFLTINETDSILINSTEIKLKSNGKIYSYSVEKELKKHILQNENKEFASPIYFSLGDYEITLIGSLYYYKDKYKKPHNISFDYDSYLLLKKRK